MLLRDLPIKLLLVAGFLFSGLLPLMAVALMSLSVAREELNYQAFRQLESVRDIKKSQLARFFDERVRQTEMLAADPYVKEVLGDFERLIDGHEGIGRRGFKGKGEGAFEAPDAYIEVHEAHYEFFEMWTRKYEYYDVFLMNPADGFTYLTVEKEADFGISIGKIESSLKDVWRVAATLARAAVSDTRPYAPSGDIPAQFIAAPVMEGKRVIGVAAAQISLKAIDDFMSARSGMGRTGETYLVGPDGRMRSDSYLDPGGHSVVASFAGTVEDNGVSTSAVKDAFAGRTGARKLVGYNGNTVLSAYAPVSFGGVTWAIIAEIDEAEIDARIAEALNTRITVIIFLSLALLLVLALAISLFISKGIARVKNELNLLMDGVLSGRGDRRGDPEKVAYDFRGVVSKTNDLIDAYQAKSEEGRKLEEIVAYNQRMESIGTLAGGIAHDFNNILAYMLTYGDLVLDDLEEGSKAYERMQEILAGVDRAGELVAQIMTFGRQLKRDKRPVEVALIVKESVKLLKATIPKNIEVVREINGEGIKVMADPTQLHRIVMNLCTNAFHAMLDSGGRITVSLTEKTLVEGEVKKLAAGRYCELTVADTGAGIKPEIVDRIFEPFFTTKPVGQGSGMGLPVVHGIVASYEGEVSLKSEPGVGTTVRVYLPMRDDVTVPEDGGGRAKLVRGSGRVLLVDDEEPVCASVALMIESLGYQVDATTDPEEALSLFSKEPDKFVAVVSDINMPRINGVDLARRMIAIRKDLPLLLVTGYNDLITAQSVVELKAEVLIKPFKKSEFSSALADLIGRRS